MRYKEILESPQEAEPTDFGLDDYNTNKKFARSIITKEKEILEDEPEYIIIRTGDDKNGWFVLYNKSSETIDYAIKIQTKTLTWAKLDTVTQCVLWRDIYSPYTDGLTRKMLFNVLLKRYPAIMSDRLQTKNGHIFWQARMTNAIALGYHVGVAYLNSHEINWYEKTIQTYKDWMKGQDTFWQTRMTNAIALGYHVGVAYLNSHEINWYEKTIQTYKDWMKGQDTFGNKQKYQAIRYIISN